MKTKHKSLQWKAPKSPRSKKMWQVKLNMKAMTIAFFFIIKGLFIMNGVETTVK